MASWGPWEFIDRAFYSQSDLRKHHLQGLITSKFPAFATCSNIKTVSSVGGRKKEKRSQSPNIHPQITATPHKRCLSGQTSHFPEWTCKFMQVLQSLIYSYMLCECLIVCCWITAPTKRQLLDKLDHITQKNTGHAFMQCTGREMRGMQRGFESSRNSQNGILVVYKNRRRHWMYAPLLGLKNVMIISKNFSSLMGWEL